MCGGMQPYKRLRREYEHGLGPRCRPKYKLHRRTVRAALQNGMPRSQKVTPRERPKIALAIPFFDAILKNDLTAPFNQRHTARKTPAASRGGNSTGFPEATRAEADHILIPVVSA
jgi:hypothetical protein